MPVPWSATLGLAPSLLQQAITELAASPDQCVLIGDQTTGMQAARATGIDSIGLNLICGKSVK